jgi:hypothetical protein
MELLARFSRKINEHCSAAIESENKRNFPYVVIQGLVHSAEDIPASQTGTCHSGQRTPRPDKCDGRDAGEGEHHHGALLLE